MPRLECTMADTRVRMELAGWLHRFRQLSHVSFLVLRDGQAWPRWSLRTQVQVAELVAATLGGVEVHAPEVGP